MRSTADSSDTSRSTTRAPNKSHCRIRSTRVESGSAPVDCHASRLGGGGQGSVGGAAPEPSLHFRSVGAEERPAHATVARLELGVLNILGEIGGLREEVVDAKAAGEALLKRPRRGVVASGQDSERGAGPIGHEIAEREAAAPARIELFLEEPDGVAGSLG